MNTEFLVKRRQSNKCASVRNDEIFNLHFASGVGDSLISSGQTINQKKVKNTEIRFNSQQIISYYLGLRTKDPGLREVDLKPSPKRVSDKIKICSNFLVFPSVIKMRKFTLPMSYQHRSKTNRSKTNRGDKLASWNDKLDLQVWWYYIQ